MHYIFIVNDVNFMRANMTGKEIADWLLEKKIWLFSIHTPNLKKFKVNDSVVIYVAGKGNRYFYANFTIAGDVANHSLVPINEKEKELAEYFELYCPIKEINVLPTKVYINDIKDDLCFIIDKKNYGLFLRQSTKVISERDFLLITKGQ